MGLIKKLFAPIIQYYERLKAEAEERRRRAELRKQRIQYIKTNGQYICAVRKLNSNLNLKN